MKQLYYIAFHGRYEMKNGKLSTRRTSFSVKDTNTDFKENSTVTYKGRFFHIDKILYEPLKGCYR